MDIKCSINIFWKGGGNGRLNQHISVTFFSPCLKRGWRGKKHSAFYSYTLTGNQVAKWGKKSLISPHFPRVIRYFVRLFIVVVKFEETWPPRYFRPSIPRMKFHSARGKRPSPVSPPANLINQFFFPFITIIHLITNILTTNYSITIPNIRFICFFFREIHRNWIQSSLKNQASDLLICFLLDVIIIFIESLVAEFAARLQCALGVNKMASSSRRSKWRPRDDSLSWFICRAIQMPRQF